jgi:hypothetical protein
MADIMLRVNSAGVALSVDPRLSLLDLLLERLGLTGSKKGCDHGQCGACTVLIDGRRANACQISGDIAGGEHPAAQRVGQPLTQVTDQVGVGQHLDGLAQALQLPRGS